MKWKSSCVERLEEGFLNRASTPFLGKQGVVIAGQSPQRTIMIDSKYSDDPGHVMSP